MLQKILIIPTGVWSDLAAGGDALRVASTGCLVLATDREYAGIQFDRYFRFEC